VGVHPLQHSRHATLLEVTMHEGRNRQIRRTAERLGHPVRDLLRVAIGAVALGQLPEGHWRRLDPSSLS
jgi:pseudouridine synthase